MQGRLSHESRENATFAHKFVQSLTQGGFARARRSRQVQGGERDEWGGRRRAAVTGTGSLKRVWEGRVNPIRGMPYLGGGFRVEAALSLLARTTRLGGSGQVVARR
jgi:hypothetical protein